MGFPNGAESQNESANSHARAKFGAEADRHKADRLIRSLREDNDRLRSAEAKAWNKVNELLQTATLVEAEQDRLRRKVNKQAVALSITLSALSLGAMAFVGRELTRPKTLRERLIEALKG